MFLVKRLYPRFLETAVPSLYINSAYPPFSYTIPWIILSLNATTLLRDAAYMKNLIPLRRLAIFNTPVCEPTRVALDVVTMPSLDLAGVLWRNCYWDFSGWPLFVAKAVTRASTEAPPPQARPAPRPLCSAIDPRSPQQFWKSGFFDALADRKPDFAIHAAP
jgi:hypothetical protein